MFSPSDLLVSNARQNKDRHVLFVKNVGNKTRDLDKDSLQITTKLLSYINSKRTAIDGLGISLSIEYVTSERLKDPRYSKLLHSKGITSLPALITPRKVFQGFRDITSFYEQLIYVSKKNSPQVSHKNMLDDWNEYIQRKNMNTDTSDDEGIGDRISDNEISKRLSDLEKSREMYHPFGKPRYETAEQNNSNSFINRPEKSVDLDPDFILENPGGFPGAKNSLNSFTMPESIVNQLKRLNEDEMVHYQNMIDGMS